MADRDKRLRYYSGQFLQEEDFIAVQEYHLDRQRQHNRQLHTGRITARCARAKTRTRKEIRSVALAAGTAKFRIYSETAKRLATVQMLAANLALRLGGVQVESLSTAHHKYDHVS